MDEAGRNRLVRFVRFLGDVLGPQTEIVVHFFDDDRSYVGAIVNGHVSGRDENAPLTGLARRFVEERVYLRQDSVRNYRGVARGNENIRSSTYFITDEHRNLEAMICFNIDTSEYVELAHRLLQLGHADDVEGMATPAPFANDDQGRPFIEYFSESLKDVVYSLVPKGTDPVRRFEGGGEDRRGAGAEGSGLLRSQGSGDAGGRGVEHLGAERLPVSEGIG